MDISLTRVLNAFLPNKIIDSAEKFAGRKEAVEQAYFALLSQGTNIAVIGNRGIGKSSLAQQIINIANGDMSLLKKLGIQTDEKLDYLTAYYACGNNINDFESLLVKILTSKECLGNWIYDIPSATKELQKHKPGLNLGVATYGAEHQKEVTSTKALANHGIDIVFQNVVSIIENERVSRDGLLIVIDEFDQIKDPTGFASFLKSMATNNPNVKFVIIGVAQDLSNLIKEHQSADRLFAGGVINLPSMSDGELIEIIRGAESSIDRKIRFDESAVQKLLLLSKGHPYMIHLLGRTAYQSAHKAKKDSIDDQFIDYTLQSIAQSGMDPVLERRYKEAITSSPQREAVLKSLAQSVGSDGEVFTTTAYKVAIDYMLVNLLPRILVLK